MMFETFGVTGLFTSEQPILALYGCGRVSGLCVDLGAEKVGAAIHLKWTFTLTTHRRRTAVLCFLF